MKNPRIGLWLIGAFGGVATCVTLGLVGLARRLTPTTGLVTAQPLFDGLGLPEPADFIIGGHDIRQTSFQASAEEFHAGSNAIEPELVIACKEELRAATARVRPGTKLGCGPTIDRLGDWGGSADFHHETTLEALDRVGADLDQFQKETGVDHVIVLNVSSTEPVFKLKEVHHSWPALNEAMNEGGDDWLPASSIYALAALLRGHTYLNFTPSLGASMPALDQVAKSTGALYGGKDGKTGETLMKTVLAPMFARRNLEVLSWVGHNIFGNRDGVVLDDPANKASKVETKDKVVSSILGYKPQTLVTIEYIPDMGDWKTAWDHIHFRGFLGVKMALQFTWQGCDSLLAAPLAIDLARLADLERKRGGSGLMVHLASFFKSPEGINENDFFEQFRALNDYLTSVRASLSATS